MVLLKSEGFGQQAQVFPVAWIQAFPEAAFIAAIAPEPGFTALCRAACLRLGSLFGFFGWSNHGMHLSFF
jgi:hypothetical protein